jgi:CubicO group peptidase (beta-lactamase class C family)
MKKISFLFICLVCSLPLFAQNREQARVDSVARLVRAFYAAGESEKMYALAGEAFTKQISAEQFSQILPTLKQQLGNWNSNDLVSFNNGLAHYKAGFDNANMSFYLKLEESGKYSTLLFQQYKAPVTQKNYTVPSDNPMTTALDKEVDKIARPFISQINTVGMAIGLVKGDSVFVYCYGETAKGNKYLPNSSTLFEIGSISKTFTVTLLALAIGEGKVNALDPINQYLPDSIAAMVYNKVPITLQSLTNHSSGLPRLPMDLFLGKELDTANPYKHYSRQKLFNYLKAFKPYREPGKQFEYSNLAVGLLGTILESIYKSDYDALMRRKIFKPLRMSRSHVKLSPRNREDMAQGYNDAGNAQVPWDFDALAGAGAIRSNVNDMVKYIQAQLGKGPKALVDAINLTHQETFSFGQNRMGMGWFLPDKDLHLTHGGQTGGYVSTVHVNKETKTGLVILTNTSVSVEAVAGALMNVLGKK